MGKNIEILDKLLSSIGNRDGQKRIDEIKGAWLKEETLEAIARDNIVQIIAEEKPWARGKFLGLYPGLILPYLTRVRAKKS